MNRLLVVTLSLTLLELFTTAATADPICSLSQTSMDFGSVCTGSIVDQRFGITNYGPDTLTGEVSASCEAFSIVSGEGPFALGTGEYIQVEVRFAPPEPGDYECVINTGTVCPPVVASGTVPPNEPACSLSRSFLSFGNVYIRESETGYFRINNVGCDTLAGTVSESCPDFSIVTGEGLFALAPGGSRYVQVMFAPISAGEKTCTIDISGICTDFPVSGHAFENVGPGQSQAVIALHPTARVVKGECDNAPAIPCSEYLDQWPVNTSCDLWLVVARGAEPGIGGLSCGIEYSPDITVFEWAFCASGWQMPDDIGSGEWPASHSGNRMTWNTEVDCQTTVLGSDGIHAVAGSFYVYAYGAGLFELTQHELCFSPLEFNVLDCNGVAFDLPYPEAAGVVVFGDTTGYNPCDEPAPVRLLAFTAARVDAGAEVRWTVAGADNDHLGFEVYRGLAVGDRARVSTELLTGRETYVFVDADPPSTAVSYWLAERSRTGETSWHGPVELAAASVPGPGLVLRHASPNPFLGTTRIAFRTGLDGPVTVRIFDTAGREVARPFSGAMPAGDHEVAWDGRDDAGRRLSAGVYLYRVESAQGGGAGKVVLIR